MPINLIHTVGINTAIRFQRSNRTTFVCNPAHDYVYFDSSRYIYRVDVMRKNALLILLLAEQMFAQDGFGPHTAKHAITTLYYMR